MLARHAEDLFWIGRYLERAEDTARLLNVTYHSSLEVVRRAPASTTRGRSCCRCCTSTRRARASTGSASPGSWSPTGATRGRSPRWSLRARENARGVREWLTLELWEEINAFHLELAAMDLGRALEARPYALCELIRRRCETIVGVATVAMPRTEGYQFMTLGQLLERAGITARLLSVWDAPAVGHGRRGRVRGVDQGAALGRAPTRRTCASTTRMFDGSRVIPFLLRARELPRSVLYCLEVAERQLGVAVRRTIWSRVAAGHRPGPVAGGVRGPGIAVGCRARQDSWSELESGIQELGRLIEEDYFRDADFGLHAYETF